MQPRSGLYRLEAYGLGNTWNLWAIEHGILVENTPSRIHAEDFGDAEARAIAEKLFRVSVDPHKRINMYAPIFGR